MSYVRVVAVIRVASRMFDIAGMRILILIQDPGKESILRNERWRVTESGVIPSLVRFFSFVIIAGTMPVSQLIA